MNYKEIHFTITPFSNQNCDLLIAWLSDLPFEGFSETDKGLKAYIPSKIFNENELLRNLKNIASFQVEYSISTLEDQNWNQIWEENYFEPILIGEQCLVRGSSHQSNPQVQWEIIINPKLSFGSGHHQTTKMILELLLEMDLSDKTVLDMGCGTGILAILASMKKAKDVLAIDIDEWSYENTIENSKNNGQNLIKVELGGAEQIGKRQFDIILANINTNILLKDLPVYKKALLPQGILVLSGFLTCDKAKIIEKTENLNLTIHKEAQNEEWCTLVLKI